MLYDTAEETWTPEQRDHVRTQAEATHAQSFMMYPGGVVVQRDGSVFIDWSGLEHKLASYPYIQPMDLLIARLLISVRDGTWKPMVDYRPA